MIGDAKRPPDGRADAARRWGGVTPSPGGASPRKRAASLAPEGAHGAGAAARSSEWSEKRIPWQKT